MLLFVLVVARMAMLVDQVNLQARQLEHLARTDPLTGAANRRALDEALEQALARFERDARPFAVALLDLDHFKEYNDTHGHLAGDKLISEVVSRWESHLRETDQLARFGGEEFAVILPGCSADSALVTVERLRRVVPGRQTCSAGIAVACPGASTDQLLGEADDALYMAKAAGRDRAELAPGIAGSTV